MDSSSDVDPATPLRGNFIHTAGRDTLERLATVIGAFDSDGFDVNRDMDVVFKGDYFGVRATHRTAVIGSTGKRKKAFYIEGDPATMGYLQGLLSEPEIERMCTEFNEKIVFDFINVQVKDPALRKIIGEILEDIIYLISMKIIPDIPRIFNDEIEGMITGCTEAHPATKVDRESLWVLNVGIDAILSYIYTGLSPHTKPMAILMKPEYFRLPIMCNGFSSTGIDTRSQSRYHYLGRDFMFSTAGVYQDTATMIIRRPVDGLPMVSVAAPGMIGTIAGFNSEGVGVGVDMSPASNCNPSRPGLNSLLLTRYSIQTGRTCDESVRVIIDAQRGVSWAYILADGTADKACILESGEFVDSSFRPSDFLVHTDHWVVDTLKEVDPGFEDLLKTPSTKFEKGVMVRWNNYTYPLIYQQFNQTLIDTYKNLNPDYGYVYRGADFGEKGRINKTWKDKNCPGPFYFAPQRAHIPEMTLMTNHCIVPEMRFHAMNLWISIIAASNLNDIQWRYDELNAQLLTALGKGYITYQEAKAAIDFLAPTRNFPGYYNPERKPLDQVPIHGSVSLMDLKAKTIETHYGYYADEWIRITLGNYIG